MIPKVIHYCWFGRGEKPKLAKKCIKSWEKYCPDYEIKEWNEDNFDIDLYPYAREAYNNKKYAFVTDVVRLYALVTDGGVYMDTDVEVIKPIDRFLTHHAFSGFQDYVSFPTGIMGSEKGGKWAQDNLNYYNDRHFIQADGTIDIKKTNVEAIMEVMLPYNVNIDNTYQDFEEYFTLYPKEYFCPTEHVNDIKITKNTYTIHHFAGSWNSWHVKLRRKIIRLLGKKVWNFIITMRGKIFNK